MVRIHRLLRFAALSYWLRQLPAARIGWIEDPTTSIRLRVGLPRGLAGGWIEALFECHRRSSSSDLTFLYYLF